MKDEKKTLLFNSIFILNVLDIKYIIELDRELSLKNKAYNKL